MSGRMANFVQYTSYFTGAMAACGVVTNGISLSFFLRKTERQLGNQLLVLLNITDIVVCIYCFACQIVSFLILPSMAKIPVSGSYVAALLVVNGGIRFCTEVSALVTTFLCVVRMLAMVYPLRPICKQLIFKSLSVITGYLVAKEIFSAVFSYPELKKFIISTGVVEGSCPETLQDWIANDLSRYVKQYLFYNIIPVLEMLVMIILVTTCSFISMKKLTTPDAALGVVNRNDSNNRAAMMVIILGGLFVLFNSVWACVRGTQCIQMMVLEWDDCEVVQHFFQTTMLLFVVGSTFTPLNSALNPVVYMKRNTELRSYVTGRITAVVNKIRGSC